MVCIDMTGLTALCHYNCGAWQLVGLQTQEFYNILSLFVCGTPFLMAEYPLVTCLLILHLSHRIWKSDCSFGSLLGVAAAETDTKPQGGRNFAMLHFLPSYQIPVLAVVDIGKNPYTNACQRLLNGCHRMRMSLKISRYVIQKANSDKTYQFLCCRCTCQQWEHRLLPLPAGLEVQPKLSSLSPLADISSLYAWEAQEVWRNLLLVIVVFPCNVENVPMKKSVGAHLLWRVSSQMSFDSKSIKNRYRFWK